MNTDYFLKQRWPNCHRIRSMYRFSWINFHITCSKLYSGLRPNFHNDCWLRTSHTTKAAQPSCSRLFLSEGYDWSQNCPHLDSWSEILRVWIKLQLRLELWLIKSFITSAFESFQVEDQYFWCLIYPELFLRLNQLFACRAVPLIIFL